MLAGMGAEESVYFKCPGQMDGARRLTRKRTATARSAQAISQPFENLQKPPGRPLATSLIDPTGAPR